MSDMPLISIVTPSYNQGKFIGETIESVLNQSYTNFEYIIMDGGSTDETLEVIRRYDTDERLHWVSEVDKGQSDAINKGMRRAKGEILAYLNSDDIYLPDAFQAVVDTFTAFPIVDLVYGHCHTMDASSKRLDYTYVANDYSLELALIRRWNVAQPATFWRRRVLDNIGLFDEALHYAMDYDYWLRAVLSGHQPKAIHQALAAFRQHDESKTGMDEERFIDDLRRSLEKAYQRDDLSEEVLALKPVANSYFNLNSADILWNNANYKGARPYLIKTIIKAGYLKARLRAAMMLLDSYLQTSFHRWLPALYNRLRRD